MMALHTPNLSSRPDDYCANVHYARVLTLKTKGWGIHYQTRLYVLAQVMNQQLLSDINIHL